MANLPVSQQQKVLYWLILVTLGVISVIIIFSVYSQYNADTINQVYSSPFRDRSPRQGAAQTYRTPGLRESEIPKRKGNRYETY